MGWRGKRGKVAQRTYCAAANGQHVFTDGAGESSWAPSHENQEVLLGLEGVR